MMNARIQPSACIVGIVMLLAKSCAAWAHPHVFVDGDAWSVFHAKTRTDVIRNIWRARQPLSVTWPKS
jgi:ABC-type uncharacterized transport system substrate-binding protein